MSSASYMASCIMARTSLRCPSFSSINFIICFRMRPFTSYSDRIRRFSASETTCIAAASSVEGRMQLSTLSRLRLCESTELR